MLSYLLTSERCIPSRQNEIAPSPRHAASRNAASMEAASSRQMACPPSHRTWVVRVRVRVRIRVRVRVRIRVKVGVRVRVSVRVRVRVGVKAACPP